MNPKRKTRSGLINWQRHQLFMPRFQMTLILFLTGLVGFLSSFLLLHNGISQMWIRYPLAIVAAYASFLLLLRLWLGLYRSQDDYNSSDLGINSDFSIGGGSGDAFAPNANFSFGGNADFGGGGAGGSWGDSVSFTETVGGSGFDGISLDLDLEEFGLVILAIVALLGGIVASLYVVYIAPFLLAEILVDGLLLRGLYKRVGNIERKHWLQTAVRKTLVPMLLCVLFFGVAGGVLQKIAPEATSIGKVWSVLTTQKSAD